MFTLVWERDKNLLFSIVPVPLPLPLLVLVACSVTIPLAVEISIMYTKARSKDWQRFGPRVIRSTFCLFHTSQPIFFATSVTQRCSCLWTKWIIDHLILWHISRKYLFEYIKSSHAMNWLGGVTISLKMYWFYHWLVMCNFPARVQLHNATSVDL